MLSTNYVFNQPINLMGRVFTSGPVDWDLITGRHTKDSKNGT